MSQNIKLIKFKVEDLSVPPDWNRPYYTTLEHPGLRQPVGINDESITTMPMVDAKRVDYELVWIRKGDSPLYGGKEWKFYVNFEEARLAMPILEAVVNNQTRKIRKENMDLTMLNMHLQSVVKKYESYWFNRFWSWLKGKVSSN